MAEPLNVDERLVDLIRAVLEGSTEPLKQYHPKVAKALACLADHFQEKITLQGLAAQAYVSRSHLGRLFREEMGVSPMRFLTLLRVEKSKLMLADRWCSVTDACEASGFPDSRALERAFKNWVGCTPMEYRKKALRQPKRS